MTNNEIKELTSREDADELLKKIQTSSVKWRKGKKKETPAPTHPGCHQLASQNAPKSTKNRCEEALHFERQFSIDF